MDNREKESLIVMILVKNISDIFPGKTGDMLEPSKHLDVEVGSLLGTFQSTLRYFVLSYGSLSGNRAPLGSRNRSISAYTMVP